MDIGQITEAEVRKALEGIRQAKPLKGCDLLEMATLQRQLHGRGIAASRDSLEWALAELLERVIWQHLAHLRGRPEALPHELTPQQERLLFAQDFQQDNAELETWSALYYRYMSKLGLQQRELATIAKPGYDYGIRHIQRRIQHGFALLAQALRGLEQEASRSAPSTRVGTRPLDDGRLTNLPLPLSTFIGRGSELRALGPLVAERRLVTLTGPGGIGKTRLAVQVAAEQMATFDGGVWWVELAAIQDPNLVPQAVAMALDLREEPGRPLTETLIERLRQQHTLLVLDNCEHLLQACALLAASLLRTCPRLAVLATSRAALHIAGEKVWPVAPLGVPAIDEPPDMDHPARHEAMQLFVERATDASPSFALTPENAPVVAQICRRLDGIPLAIELAAARLRALSLAQILARLDDRLRLLSHGSREVAERHQTLWAAIDWSYDLLAEPAQHCLRRLAVFRGGWRLSAAEAVCAGDGLLEDAIVDLLTDLVDQSLVVVEESELGRRFRLLETIGQFAREQLAASGELENLRARHLAWCLDLAEQAEPQLRGPDQSAWLQRLEAEHDNLRAALDRPVPDERPSADAASEARLRLAVALALFWQIRGYLHEGRERLIELLDLYGPAQRTALRAQALRAAGVLTHLQGDYAGARALYEESLAIQETLGDPQAIAALYDNLGIIAQGEGDYVAAKVLHEQSLAIDQELGDQPGVLRSLINLGTVAFWQGDLGEACRRFEEGLALARVIGDQRRIALLVGNLGNVAWSRGDHASAQRLFEESLAIRRQLGDQRGITHSLSGLGSVAHWQGDFASARRFYEESLQLNRALGDRLGIAQGLNDLGQLAYDERDFATARRQFEEALTIVADCGDRLLLAESLELMAALTHAEGDQVRAARLFGAASARRTALGVPAAPHEQQVVTDHLNGLHESLGEPMFTAAWDVGAAADDTQAVTWALGN